MCRLEGGKKRKIWIYIWKVVMSANRKWHRHRWPSWCALCTSICMWNISWIITNLIPLLQRQTKLTYSVSDDSIVTRDAIGVQLSKTFSTNFAYISAFASSISNCNRQSQRSIYFPQLYVPSIWAWMIQRGRSRSLITFGGTKKKKQTKINRHQRTFTVRLFPSLCLF